MRAFEGLRGNLGSVACVDVFMLENGCVLGDYRKVKFVNGLLLILGEYLYLPLFDQ